MVVVVSCLLALRGTVLAIGGHDGENVTASVEHNVLDLLAVRRTEIQLTHVTHVAEVVHLDCIEIMVHDLHELMLLNRCSLLLIPANHAQELLVLRITVRLHDLFTMLDLGQGLCAHLTLYLIFEIEDMLLQFHWDYFSLDHQSGDLARAFQEAHHGQQDPEEFGHNKDVVLALRPYSLKPVSS